MRRFPKSLMLIAGAASAAGFAPLGAWPVTLAAYALAMLVIGDAANGRCAFVRGWLFGLGQFTVGLNWIAHAFDFQDAMPHWFGYGAVVLLSLYLAVYPGLAALAAWWVARPRRPDRARLEQAVAPRPGAAVRFSLAFAAAWVVTEYLRATLFTGFAWNPLAAITVAGGYRPDGIAGISAWLGTYGLSGSLILLAGAWLWVVRRLPHFDPATVRPHADPGFRTLAKKLVGAGIILAPIVLFVGVPIPTGTVPAVREIGPAIRVVQPNIGQAERHDRNSDEVSVRRLERLTGLPSATPRLILWPEAAVPYYLEEESWARYRLARLLGPRDLLLTGGTTLNYDRRGDLVSATNSLFVMNADGKLISRYDKAHLVPYGEYLPMRPLLSAIGLSKLVQSDVDFVPGAGLSTLVLPGFARVGVQICYEIIFSGEVALAGADRPDFIFNPSTDAWFGAWGPPQHLAQARLRAIETGLPVVRATPTGISAVIDADGQLLAALPLGKAGFLDTRLPPPHRTTVFAQLGNPLPLGLALAILLGVALVPRQRYGRKPT